MRKGELTTTLAIVSLVVILVGAFSGSQGIKIIQTNRSSAQQPLPTPKLCPMHIKTTIKDEQGNILKRSDLVQPEKWGISNDKQLSQDSTEAKSKFTGNQLISDYQPTNFIFKDENSPNAPYAKGEKISYKLFADESYKIIGRKILKCHPGNNKLGWNCESKNGVPLNPEPDMIRNVLLDDCGLNFEAEWIVRRECTLDSKVTVKDANTNKVLTKDQMIDPSLWGISNSKQDQARPVGKFNNNEAVLTVHSDDASGSFVGRGGQFPYGEDITMKLFTHPAYEVVK